MKLEIEINEGDDLTWLEVWRDQSAIVRDRAPKRLLPFIIRLLLGLWNLKSANFDSQETLDGKLSGKWYRRQRR